METQLTTEALPFGSVRQDVLLAGPPVHYSVLISQVKPGLSAVWNVRAVGSSDFLRAGSKWLVVMGWKPQSFTDRICLN